MSVTGRERSALDLQRSAGGRAPRDEKLTRLGYRIVRVDAALVMRDAAAALAVVKVALK